MMITHKTCSLIAGIVICSLLVLTGCAPVSEQAAEPKVTEPKVLEPKVVEPKVTEPKAVEPKVVQPKVVEPKVVEPKVVEPKVVEPNVAEPKVVTPRVTEPKVVEPNAPPAETVTLALKFKPQDSTTYKLITEAQRIVKFEGSLTKQKNLKGGQTGSKTEMTFTQKIQSVDNVGNAIAKITIKELKYLARVRDKAIVDFDSSKTKDPNSPLLKLIGKSYTIQITPTGNVLKLVDASEAQAAVRGGTTAHKTAATQLSPSVVKERHSINALPARNKNRLRPGDNWNRAKTFAFGIMGSKSYQRAYKLKNIKKQGKRSLATIEMNATPSADNAQQLHQQKAMGAFSNMFDNVETYTGELTLDLTAGKIEKYFEKLQSEWVAVEPSVGEATEKEPAILRMKASRFHSLEKID